MIADRAVAQWPWPGDSEPVFVPLGLYPPPGHPNAPASTCPIQRQSGVFGFKDSMGTTNPNDDREYFVACRSDGVFLIDATPVAGANGSGASSVTIPATNSVTFVAEPDWSYLGDPGVNVPAPGISWDPTAPRNANSDLDDQLHGLTHSPAYLPRDAARAYCQNPAMYPFPYSTRHTTNREAVVYPARDSSSSAPVFFAYSISTLHPGIWVIPILRNANGVLYVDQASPGAWHYGDPAQSIGNCHMIYLDKGGSGRGPLLWITDDTHGTTRAVWIQGDGTLDPVLAFDYIAPNPVAPLLPLSPHDAMPVGDYLFVTYPQGLPTPFSPSRIDVFDLARVFAIQPLQQLPPTTLTSQPDLQIQGHYQLGSHSVLLDLTSTPEPSLWVMVETTYPGQINNIVRFRFNGLMPPTEREVHNRLPAGFPANPVPPTEDAPVHHIRAVGDVGFAARYNSGLALIDLSATHNPNPVNYTNMTVLGAYDTSPLMHPNGETIQIRELLNNFLGTWDVSPWQDSGLVYASAGEYGGLVLQVTEAHLNRYWDATPFPALSAGPGLFPRIELASAPPREGHSFTLVDANKATYPTARNGVQVGYRYSLFWSTMEPSLAVSWVPPWLAANPNANSGYFNLVEDTGTISVPGQVGLTQLTNQILGDDRFEFREGDDTLPRGTKVFLQLVVEEVDKLVGGAQVGTGRWAASRGTWVGIARN